jgi:pentatricopeptide repeat protein
MALQERNPNTLLGKKLVGGWSAVDFKSNNAKSNDSSILPSVRKAIDLEGHIDGSHAPTSTATFRRSNNDKAGVHDGHGGSNTTAPKWNPNSSLQKAFDASSNRIPPKSSSVITTSSTWQRQSDASLQWKSMTGLTIASKVYADVDPVEPTYNTKNSTSSNTNDSGSKAPFEEPTTFAVVVAATANAAATGTSTTAEAVPAQYAAERKNTTATLSRLTPQSRTVQRPPNNNKGKSLDEPATHPQRKPYQGTTLQDVALYRPPALIRTTQGVNNKFNNIVARPCLPPKTVALLSTSKTAPPPSSLSIAANQKVGAHSRGFMIDSGATGSGKAHEEISTENPNEPESFKTLEEYGRTLHYLLNRGTLAAARDAESILRTMILNSECGRSDIQPDGACFNSVIHAYAKLGMTFEAESILRLMFRNYKQGNAHAQPNVRVFTNVLHGWRKSEDPDAPERCESLIEEMYKLSVTDDLPHCKPDCYSVTVLLHTWVESNRDDAADRAACIFSMMKQRFLKGDEGLCPDCIAYSIVLVAYAQKSDPESQTKAEMFLWDMVDDFLGGNEDAAPRTRNFNTIMSMYARNLVPDAPERAENVLERFLTLSKSGQLTIKPDEYTYSLLLKTW